MGVIQVLKDSEGLKLPCYEENGVAYLRLENVARGLGFTQTQNKNGGKYTSVRWETVFRYLDEIGFPEKLGKEDFIPENVFYRLAMKARSKTAEKFQAWVADVVVPSIRKHGGYVRGQESLDTKDLEKVLEVVQMLQGKIDAQKHLVDFATHVQESADSIDINSFAKLLNDDGIDIGRNRLIKWFKNNHYLMEDGTPYQRWVNAKLFELVEKLHEFDCGTKRTVVVPYITGKGQIYFLDKIKEQIAILGDRFCEV